VIEHLDALSSLADLLGARARSAGTLLIWRTQIRSVHRVLVQAGKTEESSTATSLGHGIQVFTPEGGTAFASRDDFREDEAAVLLDRALEIAASGTRLGLHASPLPDLVPERGREVPPAAAAFERIDLHGVALRLAELEAEIAAQVPGVTLKLSYTADRDAWRIFRSDGTDVLYVMPRCVLRVQATARGREGPHSVGCSLGGPDPGLPWDEISVRRLLQRAESAARLAQKLPDAPPHRAGSFPMVIDYALAKGLAHEAFGHASEADGYRSSILARDGKLRIGEEVGARHVSIVDEPVPGDHAWQPWSANGIRRGRAVIVDHGRLAAGLADPWSAAQGGVAITDAARAESFRNPPLPRMSNIRIEVGEPAAAPGTFESYGPEEVRDLLAAGGVLRRHRRLTFLSGYAGGQVNPATGDFVFQCKAVYELSQDGIVLHRPAIFAGSMFGALRSVREAFGPLRLDALGTCGKWGQNVPSSGGSHYFVVLDPDPTVRLGGA